MTGVATGCFAEQACLHAIAHGVEGRALDDGREFCTGSLGVCCGGGLKGFSGESERWRRAFWRYCCIARGPCGAASALRLF